MASFEKALICYNGDIITSCLANNQHYLEAKYCVKCGAKIISSCPSCGEVILGCEHYPYDDWVTNKVETYYSGYTLPMYCHSCGKSYPWTDIRLKAGKELISLMNELEESEKELLEKNLVDVITDTPRSTVAATIVQRVIKKATPLAQEGFKQLFFDVSIEAAKRLIWP